MAEYHCVSAAGIGFMYLSGLQEAAGSNPCQKGHKRLPKADQGIQKSEGSGTGSKREY